MYPLDYFIILSTILFCLGVLRVLFRKNAIIILGCVELMLNSVNLLLAAFSSYKGDGNGQILVFFIMVVAAAEVAVGTCHYHHDVQKYQECGCKYF